MQQKVIELISSLVGQANILAIPKDIIAFLEGDVEAAILFCQIMYWTPKSKSGWVAKSYDDWEEEISLSPYRVRRAANFLKTKKMIELFVRGFAGKPTCHYRINAEEFTKKFMEFLSAKSINLTSQTVGHRVSNTETTTEIERDIISLVRRRGERREGDRRGKPLQSNKTARSGLITGVPYGDVLSMLNTATGRNFANTASFRALVNARWREGARLPDFEAVIMNMTDRWGDDEKYAMYLRPQTLFGPKFDGYKNIRRGHEGTQGGYGTGSEDGKGKYGDGKPIEV